MSFEKKIFDQLRSAEQREIRDSESTLAGELARVVDGQAIAEGISMTFSGDQSALREVVTLLGLQDELKAGRLWAHPRSVARGTSYLGTLSDWVAASDDIVDCLDVLQAEQWKFNNNRLNWLPEIQVPYEHIGSQLFLARPLKDDDGRIIGSDLSVPAIALSADYRYLPEAFEKWGEAVNLVPLLRDAEETGEHAAPLLANELEMNEATLFLPGAHYSIAIGPYDGNLLTSVWNRYDFIDGKMVREKDPSDEDDA